MMVGMEVTGNRRRLEGLERDCPMPCGAGRVGELTRWVQVRDALEDMIKTLPIEERGMVARLQECWARACWRIDEVKLKEPPEWVLPF